MCASLTADGASPPRRRTPTAPTPSYAALASARTPSSRPGASCENSVAAPGRPANWPRPSMSFKPARSQDEKPSLRIRAVDQVGEGAHPEDVAAALGLHRKTVYGWLAKYREGGKDALRAQPVPGRPPKLNGQQLSRLYGLIAGQDPRQMQFEFALWTREMVREVIRREFGVSLSVVSVGRLLRKLGMSPQRPLHRAYQQNPEAVDRWKREEYPAIQAQAEAAGAVIYFADEAGIRSDYHAGTTWSPVGQTPEVKNTGARYSVNMISVVSAKGALRFAVYEGNTNAAIFIDFCKRLLHDAPGLSISSWTGIPPIAPLPRRNSPPRLKAA